MKDEIKLSDGKQDCDVKLPRGIHAVPTDRGVVNMTSSLVGQELYTRRNGANAKYSAPVNNFKE